MNFILHWKKEFFSSSYSIYSADGKIGQLNENPWKQSAEGECNNRKYLFRTRGFLKQVTEIVDPATNYSVGKIEYNAWKSRATITYLDQTFHWQYENLWQTRWSITDHRGLKVDFQGSLHKGSIEGQDITEFQILAGLFVTNYYIQSSIVIFVAIFVPIIASISN